jgi:hypothetical protein
VSVRLVQLSKVSTAYSSNNIFVLTEQRTAIDWTAIARILQSTEYFTRVTSCQLPSTQHRLPPT